MLCIFLKPCFEFLFFQSSYFPSYRALLTKLHNPYWSNFMANMRNQQWQFIYSCNIILRSCWVTNPALDAKWKKRGSGVSKMKSTELTLLVENLHTLSLLNTLFWLKKLAKETTGWGEVEPLIFVNRCLLTRMPIKRQRSMPLNSISTSISPWDEYSKIGWVNKHKYVIYWKKHWLKRGLHDIKIEKALVQG